MGLSADGSILALADNGNDIIILHRNVHATPSTSATTVGHPSLYEEEEHMLRSAFGLDERTSAWRVALELKMPRKLAGMVHPPSNDNVAWFVFFTE